MTQVVYSTHVVPSLHYTWLGNLQTHAAPLRKLLNAQDQPVSRLLKWYYFWLMPSFLDPVILTHHGGSYSLHPGQNRWLAAAMQTTPMQIPALVIGPVGLKRLPSGDSLRVINLVPGPWPYKHGPNDTWPGGIYQYLTGRQPAVSWAQWNQELAALDQRISHSGLGSLVLTYPGGRSQLGSGAATAVWSIDHDAVTPVRSLMLYARDQLEWR